MTKRVAIWILGLFVILCASPSSLCAVDYYIMRSGDMLYRVPHSVYKKRSVVSHNTEAQNQKLIFLKPQVVKASWYGPRFHGRPMANGKMFNMFEIFVAHKKLPLGTCVQIKNPENGTVVQAPISDRGPYIPGRKLDLSCYAMGILGGIENGVIPVKYQIVPGARWCAPSATVENRETLMAARERCRGELNHRN